LAGGGSGGHLFPGLVVAEQLARHDADVEVVFVCTEREIDSRILGGSGWRYVAQPVLPLPRRVGDVFRFWRAWRKSVGICNELMRADRPMAVLGLGGFASAPAMKAAAKMGVPVAMLNPDAVPGKANKFCRRYAQKIFVQWDSTAEKFGRDADKCVVTGCPIRGNLIKKPGIKSDKPTLVVVGGSLGGHNVNLAVVECLARMGKSSTLRHWRIVHITGVDDRDFVQRKYNEAAIEAEVMDFTLRMDEVLAGADLVIARAGASTLAELTAVGVGSILLPYPYHKDQHQRLNAEELAGAGAAKIVTDDCDSNNTADRLEKVLAVCMDEQVSRQMAQAAKKIGKADAAYRVAGMLEEK